MNYRDLSQAVYRALDSPEATHQRPLESYLRALLHLLRARRNESPSYSLFTELLREAFSADAPPFDEHWLIYANPPGPNDASSGADRVEHMLLYQIADLHRMETEGLLDNAYRDFGIASPTGNYWYNFDTRQFLECAASRLRAQREHDPEGADLQWSELTEVLWLGQHYE